MKPIAPAFAWKPPFEDLADIWIRGRLNPALAIGRFNLCNIGPNPVSRRCNGPPKRVSTGFERIRTYFRYLSLHSSAPYMKYLVVAAAIILCAIYPAYGQDAKNPSLLIQEVAIPWQDFNLPARDANIMPLQNNHAVSWQVTITSDILYSNPTGNTVIRFHDSFDSERYIEVGMGANPDHKFWLAAQLPREGYVVVHSKLDRGWFPEARINLSYTDRGGLTVNNGERIVVSNLDVGTFAIGSYSTYGMEGSSDPPATADGHLVVEFMSGNPSANIYALFPFVITAAVGGLVGFLYLSKRRA